MSIFAKFRLLTLGSLNDLLDRQIAKDPTALKQYVRDLETAIGEMQTQAATQAALVNRTLPREIADLNAKIELDKKTIVAVYAGTSPNKEMIAKAKAAEIVDLQAQVKEKEQSLATETVTSQQLDQAVAALDAKHTQSMMQRRSLENMTRDTHAKKKAGRLTESAAKVMGDNVGVSVDSIKAKIQQENDIQNERFARAMGSLPKPEEDPVKDAAINDLLASLRPPAIVASA